jgi:hypothetical protein
LSFEVGDFVYLKVSPMIGLRWFKVRGKLAPRFIGPLKILEQNGDVAYQLELPHSSVVEEVFHVSQLKKCLWVLEEQVALEDLIVSEDLTYQEYPVKLLGTSERVTRNKRFRCARCNGATILKKKQHGKEKKNWSQNF